MADNSYSALNNVLSKLKDKDNNDNNDHGTNTVQNTLQSRMQNIQSTMQTSQQAQQQSTQQQTINHQNTVSSAPSQPAPVTAPSAPSTPNNGGSVTTSTEESYSLDPTKSDFQGKINSFSNNGINIYVENTSHTGKVPGTLTYIDPGKSAGGIGALGNGKKNDDGAETLTIDFDEAADEVTVTLSDLGGGKYDDTIVFRVYQEGSDDPVEMSFNLPSNAPDGATSYTFTAGDIGAGDNITKVILYSETQTPSGGNGEANFLLSNVETTYITETVTEPEPEPEPDPTLADATFLVGHNVDDDFGSAINYMIGEGSGRITGDDNNDILIGDIGGSKLENQSQDYNIVMMLDVSGSMSLTGLSGQNRLDTLVDAVKGLMVDFNNYTDGEVRVHFVPFSTDTVNESTFSPNEDADYNDAINFLNGLYPSGVTNYEAALQGSLDWLKSDSAIQDAITVSYFISDGMPNYSLDDNGNPYYSYYSGMTAMEEITGADGSDEVSELQALSDEVIGVGVDISYGIANINIIDSDGSALNVPVDQLTAALRSTNPLNKLDSAGDDNIVGNEGNDLIFGDAINTDALAQQHGFDIGDGASWEVFSKLENGESSVKSDWDRLDTLNYIVNHQDELASETLDDDGNGRLGGNDTLKGGAGDDIIFGQEGDDYISGDDGSDILSGGSGADTFDYNYAHHGVDTITDFDTSEGDVLNISNILSWYDPLQDSINDYVFASEDNGSTMISVDRSGSGDASNAVDLVVLEGVTNVDLDSLHADGNLIV